MREESRPLPYSFSLLKAQPRSASVIVSFQLSLVEQKRQGLPEKSLPVV